MHLTFPSQTAYQTYLQNPVARLTAACFPYLDYLETSTALLVNQYLYESSLNGPSVGT